MWCVLYFLNKWAILGLFFVNFRSFSNNKSKFYNKLMWQMSIHYPALGFELMTFWPPLTTRPGLPPGVSFINFGISEIWCNLSLLFQVSIFCSGRCPFVCLWSCTLNLQGNQTLLPFYWMIKLDLKQTTVPFTAETYS